MNHPTPPVDLGRFNNLADGIFAVAMTFLAFTIQLPTQSAAGAAPRVSLAFQFANLAISFYVVGRYWIQHNRRHRLVILANEALVSLELLMLFGIILIPITLRLYNQIPGSFTGVALYASSYILVALTNIAILTYALRHASCIHANASPAAIKAAITLNLLPLAVYLTSILIALGSPTMAPVAWLLMMAMPALSRRIMAPHQAPSANPQPGTPPA